MKRDWWPLIIVWMVFFILYTITAAPSLVALFDDSLEFQVVGPTFGIAHPTGYPLYVLVGGLWSRMWFPFGNWAWRMNLFSVLAAACAVALLFALARRVSRQIDDQSNLWAGLAAAVTFGLGPIWWAQATIAEVYALHSLFVAAVLYAGFHVLNFGRHSPPLDDRLAQMSSPYGRVLILCAIGGTGLAHHRTIALVLPVFALYLLWNAPWLRRPQRAWIHWGGAFIAPLLLYLWLPIRAAQGVRDLHGSYENTWSGFWNHILASGYTGFFDAHSLAAEKSWLDWLVLWSQQMGIAAMFLGGLGMVITLMTHPKEKKPVIGTSTPIRTKKTSDYAIWSTLLANPWFYLLSIFITNLVFTLLYQVGDAEVFLLPALLVFALFIGGGVAFIGRWLQPWPTMAKTIQLLCVLMLIFGIGGRGAMIDRSQDWAIHDYAVALAKVDFPPNSRIVALEGEATALYYMQQAEGLGLHATAIVANDPEQRRNMIAALIAQGASTYLTRELDGIAQQYSFSGEGPLVRVWPRGEAHSGKPTHPVDILFAEGQIRLLGYDLVKLDQAGGPAVQISFYWYPTTQLSQTFKISLRLQDTDGASIVWPDGRPVQADHYPLRLVAKTPDWLPGETIRDVHELAIPADNAAQPLWLQVILYDEQSLAEAGVWRVLIE